MTELSAAQIEAPHASFLAAFLVPLIFVLVTAPTLTWLQFSSGSENLVVATALEIRRTGNWLFPTLQGQPRLNKPPLAAWIGATSIAPRTFSQLTSSNADIRTNAYRDLAWQIRWPALLAAALTLIATYDWAQTMLGRPYGLLAATILATTYAFLRFSHGLTTDVLLMFFVTATNAFLARALLRRQGWFGFPLAGLMLGLAFMSKGPVALLQTALPYAMYLFMQRWRRSSDPALEHQSVEFNVPAALAGFALFFIVALPWFALVAFRAAAWGIWFREIFRTSGSSGLEASKWYNYLTLFPLTFPWVLFFIAGIAPSRISKNGIRSTNPNPEYSKSRLLLLCAIFLPILVMTFFRDRKERYLLPMIPPAAILIATVVRSPRADDRWSRLLRLLHWVLLIATAVGLPVICGTTIIKGFTTPAGQPLFSKTVAMELGVICVALVICGLILSQHRRMSIAWTTLLLMLLIQASFARAYSRTESALSDMLPIADRIITEYPGATLASFSPDRRRAPEELSIYTNRTVAPLDVIPSTSEPGEHPQVLALFQENNSPPPSLPPAWQKLDSVQRKGSAWLFFVLPSR